MRIRPLAVGFWVGVAWVAAAGCTPAEPRTERVSVTSAEAQGNGNGTGDTAISEDGQVVAFTSGHPELGAVNGIPAVFVRDREAGTTEAVSVSSAEVAANQSSFNPAVSVDGRYVAFGSNASNLVAGDTGGRPDVFLRDRVAGTTERISVNSAEQPSNGVSHTPAITPDGRYVAFESDAGNLAPGEAGPARFPTEIYLRDRQSGTTQRITNAIGGRSNGSSNTADISDDGRYVAFESHATNLVAGDTNGHDDVFVHDRQTGTTELVSVSSAGVAGDRFSNDPALSADGAVVAFWSGATNLVAGDTNGATDVFVHDRGTGTTERVSLKGRTGQGNRDSFDAAISDDGNLVAFYSEVRGFAPDDTNDATDAFVRDRAAQVTERASVSTEGVGGDSGSYSPDLSANGRFVSFESFATNLVADDTNFRSDAFVRDRGTTNS